MAAGNAHGSGSKRVTGLTVGDLGGSTAESHDVRDGSGGGSVGGAHGRSSLHVRLDERPTVGRGGELRIAQKE